MHFARLRHATGNNSRYGVSVGGGSSISLIANKLAKYTSDDSGCTTVAVNTTGANFLVACVASFAFNTAPTLSDSLSQTWSALTESVQNVTTIRTRLFYVANATTSTTHTVTLVGNDAYAAVAFAAFSNVKTASPFDQEAGATGTGTSAAAGSITPSENGELLIAGVGGGPATATDPNAIGSSFTITDHAACTNAVNFGVGLAYFVQSTAAGINPAWTLSLSDTWAARIASFKAA